ncbi:hypothetical protein Tco_0050199, partial [Tanacetum coccineum]
LEAYMEWGNIDEFLAKKDKSCKRQCDDQDPPPPPPDSDMSKKKRHDYDASCSTKPPAPQSLTWKTSDTREAPSSSSNQKFRVHQYCTSSQDQVQTRLAEACSRGRQTSNSRTRLDEYKLLKQTGDISSFINWYCKRIGKKKLSKADLEGLAFKVVQPFHDNNISLQFQMEECHFLLTDQVDLVNPEGHRVMPDVSKPLPLGAPPGQVTIQSQFFFNKDLEYLVSGSKERRSALSISKLKAANYLDFRIEELVPSLWIKSEHEYDISAAYDLTCGFSV